MTPARSSPHPTPQREEPNILGPALPWAIRPSGGRPREEDCSGGSHVGARWLGWWVRPVPKASGAASANPRGDLQSQRQECMIATMPPNDFRSERSDSIEGRSIARGRWSSFMDTELPRVVESLDEIHQPTQTRLEDLDDDVREKISTSAKERSELMGFWIAWHLAGGFERLEAGGWHRATIFRKLHRFRTVFGQHPDEYRFSWIKLDLRRAWAEQITAYFCPPEEA